MNGILGSITKLKEKGADKIFYKNGSVSLSHFLGFQGFLTFSTRDSLQVSRFLSAFSKAGQITGLQERDWMEAFAAVSVSVSGQSAFTPSSYSILTTLL